MWPSGKAPLFGSGIRRFESYHPSQSSMNSKEVLLSFNNCVFGYTKSKIFIDLSFVVHQGDKIALIGKNGVGKTTLFKLLSQNLKIDDGETWFNPRINTSLMYQSNLVKKTIGIKEFILEQITDSALIDEFKVDNFFEKLKLDSRLNMQVLSGGQLRKLSLIHSLINEPDLLLLDEPTNHLDIESIKWLEKFLFNEYKGSYLIVSHNRNFLKNTTNKVFWVDRGKIRVSPKGFYFFEDWSKSLINQEERELKNKKKFLDNEGDWLSKGVKARRKRNEKRKDDLFQMRAEYKSQRSEFLKSISKIKIPLLDKNEMEGPNFLLHFHNVTKSFKDLDNEKLIVKNLNFKLMKNQKIGVIGKNGVGKSTFLMLASGIIKPNEGSIKIRNNIQFSCFNQNGQNFNDNYSIKKNLMPSGGDYIKVGSKKIHICSYLKNFLFDPKMIETKVSNLSGGEKNRLLLSKILADPKEIMILDEPTNDLDIETIDILIDFINLYNGGVLISSHDIDFLQKTCNKFIFFDGLGGSKFSIDLEKDLDFIVKGKKSSANIQRTDNKLSTKTKPISHEKLIKRVMNKIEKKEKEIFELSQKIQSSDKINNSNINFKKTLTQINEAQNELVVLEQEWIDLEEKNISN